MTRKLMVAAIVLAGATNMMAAGDTPQEVQLQWPKGLGGGAVRRAGEGHALDLDDAVGGGFCGPHGCP